MNYLSLITFAIAGVYKNLELFYNPLSGLGDPSYQQNIAQLKGIEEENILESYKKNAPCTLFYLKSRVKKLEEAYPNLDFDKVNFDPKNVWVVYRSEGQIELGAIGHTLTKEKAFLVTHPKLSFEEVDPEAWRFSIKHECGHLSHGDGLWIFNASVICTFAATVFTSSMGLWSSTFISILAYKVTETCVSRIVENRADDFAIVAATNEELLGGRRMFIALKEMNKQIHIQGVLGFIAAMSAQGDDYFAIWHPALSQRISKIEIELRKRNVAINDEEQGKIDNLRKHFIKSFFYKYPTLKFNLN